MMKWRLIIAVITTLLDEAIVFALILWGLPHLGIYLPIPVLIIAGVLWTAFAILLYIAGSKVLSKKPLSGLTDLIGFKGKAVTPISPKGMVRVNGELWEAISLEGNIQKGENIIIEKQDGLQLTIRKI
jgi:membrane-bound ClpP family serine protease